jgi:hypothetical protein
LARFQFGGFFNRYGRLFALPRFAFAAEKIRERVISKETVRQGQNNTSMLASNHFDPSLKASISCDFSGA